MVWGFLVLECFEIWLCSFFKILELCGLEGLFVFLFGFEVEWCVLVWFGGVWVWCCWLVGGCERLMFCF